MGPGCLTAVFGMGTGVAIRVWSPGSLLEYQEGSGRQASWAIWHTSRGGGARFVGIPPCVPEGCSGSQEGGINAAKRSTISTGQLRRLPVLHTRPIDLVVFQESLALRQGDLILRGVSRLDAFSVYPCRTLATQRCA
jgi:hypothetical protein